MAKTFMQELTDRIKREAERDPIPLDNVHVTRDGSVITIQVDARGDFGLSASGKTATVASTGGFMDVGDVIVSLNVNRKLPKHK